MTRPLAHWLAHADRLCREGRYFEAHEELEDAWRAATGDERLVLHGTIQIAAGLYRLRAGLSKDPAGAFYLLDKGLEKLRKGRGRLNPASLAALEEALAPIRASGRAPASFPLGLATDRS